jgi:chromosome segregation protein
VEVSQAFRNITIFSGYATRCKKDLLGILKILKERKAKGRDSFVTLAHVEDRCGFFNEFEGGRIKSLISESVFQEFVLGFQKVRSYDKVITWKGWFDSCETSIPCFVEGSDCKSIAKVGTAHKQNGKEKKTFLKLGHTSFDAVKFALQNHSIRVFSDEVPNISHTVIKSLKLVGGKLSDENILFNENLNCFIGLPGSGKSSVVEVIRYILGADFPTSEADKKHNQSYKEGLVSHFLGSGGKGVLTVKNIHGQEYSIERTLNEDVVVKNSEGETLAVDIKEVINFLYFGQKDLTYQKDRNFNFRFLRNFLEKEVRTIEKSITEIEVVIADLLVSIGKVEDLKEARQEYLQELDSLKETLKVYKEHEIDKKMQKQKHFEDDLSFIDRVHTEGKQALKTIYDLLLGKVNEFEEMKSEEGDSIDNKKEVEEVNTEIAYIVSQLTEICKQIDKLQSTEDEVDEVSHLRGVGKIVEILEQVKKREGEFREEFERIRREIQVDEIDIDAYPKITRRIEELSEEIKELDKRIEKEKGLNTSLDSALHKLRLAQSDEKTFYTEAINNINEKGLAVSIQIHEEGDRESFANFLKKICSGSNLRTKRYEKVSETFSDVIELWRAVKSDSKIIKDIFPADDQYTTFKSLILESQQTLLPFKLPYKIGLFYQGKPIEKHSDGQRASALILFTLGTGKQDLLLIDQPEDDLNSSDIYKEIVKTLIGNKNSSQFIFATHDANITVLGDCEQVICCSYYDEEMAYSTGSIDSQNSQKHIIRVMEGGEEAFSERNRIYSFWNNKL